jgi:hypothetical protein
MVDAPLDYVLAYSVAALLYGGYMLTLWRRGARARARLAEIARRRGAA